MWVMWDNGEWSDPPEWWDAESGLGGSGGFWWLFLLLFFLLIATHRSPT